MKYLHIHISLILIGSFVFAKSQSKLLPLSKLAKKLEYTYCLEKDTTKCKTGYYEYGLIKKNGSAPVYGIIKEIKIQPKNVLRLKVVGVSKNSEEIKKMCLEFPNTQELSISIYNNITSLSLLKNLQKLTLHGYSHSNLFDNYFNDNIKNIRQFNFNGINSPNEPKVFVPNNIIISWSLTEYHVNALYVPVSIPKNSHAYKYTSFNQVYPEIAYLYANDLECYWAKHVINFGDSRQEGYYQFKLSKEYKLNADIPFWYPGNTKIKKTTLVKIKNDSAVYTWKYANDTLLAQGVFKNKIPDGKWSLWYANGKLCEERFYKNGIEEGVWTFYDETGDINKILFFLEGQFSGMVILYKQTEYPINSDVLKRSERNNIGFTNYKIIHKQINDVISTLYDGTDGTGQLIRVIKNQSAVNQNDYYLFEISSYKSYKREGKTSYYNLMKELKKEVFYEADKIIKEINY